MVVSVMPSSCAITCLTYASAECYWGAQMRCMCLLTDQMHPLLAVDVGLT